jgi:hypothetical protein
MAYIRRGTARDQHGDIWKGALADE